MYISKQKTAFASYMLVLCSLYFKSAPSMAGDTALSFASSEQQVQLVELFTSQGCSSCPPADRWLNAFRESDRLWRQVIPIAFHVDYWDYLGWRDIYATTSYSDRQRRYRQQGDVRAVYTPGFVVNGNEWRGWFARSPLPASTNKSGVLKASLHQGQLTVDFVSTDHGQQPLALNVAVLGFGISTPVKAGENEGRQLKHEFVVLGHERHGGQNGHWQVTLPPVNTPPVERYGLALWVDQPGKQGPLQATGGWLAAEHIQPR